LDVVKEMASQLPIHKRIDTTEVRRIIDSYISKLDINSDYEFGIFSNGLNTRVRSADFKLNSPSTYGIPVFKYNNNTSSYQLFINFQDKKKAILSSILLMAILSGSFTIIIVFVFATAINQLIKQRQISQIKSDFINNMTHEFKTPIATINLALDSVKNPKISEKPEMVARYLEMIREENKRMHAQVENVLRISKLEKNELDIKKEKASLHEIIDSAVRHVSLIVKDRGGYIEKHYKAKDCTILANNSHFVNVIVNILDNAIKYSPESPEIDIFTEVVKNYIVLSVKDHGDGMNKTTQKKIFQKFYREHTGDVHNVKGHGLGLAYVKQIVDDHHGEVSVESDKNAGSTFIIKLPLIS
ncbi:MAG: sensor histidine kinase, partial [Psychroflexus halocasei]